MEKIAATLKHGIILNGAMTRFWVGALIICSLTFVVSLVAMLYYYYYYLIILVILSVLLDGIAIKFVVHQCKAKREIKRWLVDAIELEAFCGEVDGSSDNLESGSIGRVQVTFRYNEMDLKLMSQNGANVKFGMSTRFGTGTYFSEFINKRIKILYSPKFNEVMLLKFTQSDENIA